MEIRTPESKQFTDAVICLKRYATELAPRDISELHTFLQGLTTETDRTGFTATPADVEAWLCPARGFSDYDRRVKCLGYLANITGNSSLQAPPQEGSSRLRRAIELLFWRRTHSRMTRATSSFFRRITQQNILDTELRCAPFYRAFHEVCSAHETSGVFVESDEEVLSMLRRKIPKAELGLSIVDVGCGGGRLLSRLAREFPKAKLTGTSIFPFTEEEQKALRKQGIEPVYCTASDTGLPDASQDIVVSTEVIEHLRNPEEMIREIKRILKPGGVFCVTAPSKNAVMYCKNPFSYFAVALGTIFPGILPPFHDLYAPLTPLKIVHYAFHPVEIRKLFQNHFEIVQVYTSRFMALKKFKLDGIAPKLPIFRNMGGLCICVGVK